MLATGARWAGPVNRSALLVSPESAHVTRQTPPFLLPIAPSIRPCASLPPSAQAAGTAFFTLVGVLVFMTSSTKSTFCKGFDPDDGAGFNGLPCVYGEKEEKKKKVQQAHVISHLISQRIMPSPCLSLIVPRCLIRPLVHLCELQAPLRAAPSLRWYSRSSTPPS